MLRKKPLRCCWHLFPSPSIHSKPRSPPSPSLGLWVRLLHLPQQAVQSRDASSSLLVTASHPLNLAASLSPVTSYNTHLLLTLGLSAFARCWHFLAFLWWLSISTLQGPFLPQPRLESASSCFQASSTLGPHGAVFTNFLNPDPPGPTGSYRLHTSSCSFGF